MKSAQQTAELPGKFQSFVDRISPALPSARIITDPLKTLAYGTDASFYRLVPKVVIKSDSEEEIAEIKWLYLNKTLLQSDLAKYSGISQSFLSSILRDGAWGHVKPVQPGIIDLGLEAVSSLRLKKKQDIAEIKWLLHNRDIRQVAIAEMYGVSADTVSAIKVGRAYPNVEPAKPSEKAKFEKGER